METAAVGADPTRERSRWSSLFGGSGIKRIGGNRSRKQREQPDTGSEDDDIDQVAVGEGLPARDEKSSSPAGSLEAPARRGSKQSSLQEDEPAAGPSSDQDEITAAAAHGTEDDDDQEDQVTVDRIHFYKRDQPYFWLSNSSDHAVYLDGIRYPTAGQCCFKVDLYLRDNWLNEMSRTEHLFQSLKFLPQRPDIAAKVRKASTPVDAIREARKNISDVKRGWIGKGLNVAAMREVLLLKFSQHSTLRRQLLMTGDAELVEASPTDAFWGNASGNGGIAVGRNELGKALQKTRETILAQAGLGIGSGAVTV